jgi:hypothetical protein
MSINHTPGPWQRDDKGRTISSAKGPICECFSGPVGVEECDANERLIAAAPELLSALQGVVRVADRATDEFDAARAAIAKATGAA